MKSGTPTASRETARKMAAVPRHDAIAFFSFTGSANSISFRPARQTAPNRDRLWYTCAHETQSNCRRSTGGRHAGRMVAAVELRRAEDSEALRPGVQRNAQGRPGTAVRRARQGQGPRGARRHAPPHRGHRRTARIHSRPFQPAAADSPVPPGAPDVQRRVRPAYGQGGGRRHGAGVLQRLVLQHARLGVRVQRLGAHRHARDGFLR